MPRVFLDPDEIQEAAYVLVLHPTGVHYENQCAGYACQQRQAEGFLVPLGGTKVARLLMDWFEKAFHCASYRPAEEWGAEKIEQLRELVTQIVCWHSDEQTGEDRRAFLTLDEQRLSECTEAWVPVTTPYGAGILLFPNCD